MINSAIVLDQHAEFNFLSASSLKQQSVGRHDMLLHSDTFWFKGNQPLLLLLMREVANTNIKVFIFNFRRGLKF
jgi:hypothetical protein